MDPMAIHQHIAVTLIAMICLFPLAHSPAVPQVTEERIDMLLPWTLCEIDTVEQPKHHFVAIQDQLKGNEDEATKVCALNDILDKGRAGPQDVYPDQEELINWIQCPVKEDNIIDTFPAKTTVDSASRTEACKDALGAHWKAAGGFEDAFIGEVPPPIHFHDFDRIGKEWVKIDGSDDVKFRGLAIVRDHSAIDQSTRPMADFYLFDDIRSKFDTSFAKSIHVKDIQIDPTIIENSSPSPATRTLCKRQDGLYMAIEQDSSCDGRMGTDWQIAPDFPASDAVIYFPEMADRKPINVGDIAFRSKRGIHNLNDPKLQYHIETVWCLNCVGYHRQTVNPLSGETM